MNVFDRIIQHLAILNDQDILRAKIPQVLRQQRPVHPHGKVLSWVGAGRLVLRVLGAVVVVELRIAPVCAARENKK